MCTRAEGSGHRAPRYFLFIVQFFHRVIVYNRRSSSSASWRHAHVFTCTLTIAASRDARICFPRAQFYSSTSGCAIMHLILIYFIKHRDKQVPCNSAIQSACTAAIISSTNDDGKCKISSCHWRDSIGSSWYNLPASPRLLMWKKYFLWLR
jgi:hypothetical protein